VSPMTPMRVWYQAPYRSITYHHLQPPRCTQCRPVKMRQVVGRSMTRWQLGGTTRSEARKCVYTSTDTCGGEVVPAGCELDLLLQPPCLFVHHPWSCITTMRWPCVSLDHCFLARACLVVGLLHCFRSLSTLLVMPWTAFRLACQPMSGNARMHWVKGASVAFPVLVVATPLPSAKPPALRSPRCVRALKQPQAQFVNRPLLV
jgi:hypothetical protein